LVLGVIMRTYKICLYSLSYYTEEQTEKFVKVCSKVASLIGEDIEFTLSIDMENYKDTIGTNITNFVWSYIDWWSEDWEENEKVKDLNTLKWYITGE